MSKSRNEYKSVYGKDFNSDYSGSGKKKDPNKVSTIFGIILSILQLVTSVFLMIKLVTINILTMPLTIGLGVNQIDRSKDFIVTNVHTLADSTGHTCQTDSKLV